MGIRIENPATPNLDTYVSETPTKEVLEEIFAAEDETETPERSSIIQTGWAAAKKLWPSPVNPSQLISVLTKMSS